jgi:hypothetical protein
MMQDKDVITYVYQLVGDEVKVQKKNFSKA